MENRVNNGWNNGVQCRQKVIQGNENFMQMEAMTCFG